MARRAQCQIKCTAEYTEGCEQRFTEAMVELYYNRQRGISQDAEVEMDIKTKEETA